MYACLDIAVLEREVAVLHRAVDERQALAVAKRLRSLDMAAHERQSL